MRATIALSFALLLTRPVVVWAEEQAVAVGPWTIATSSRGDKFDSCTMSRSSNDPEVRTSKKVNYIPSRWSQAPGRLKQKRRLKQRA